MALIRLVLLIDATSVTKLLNAVKGLKDLDIFVAARRSFCRIALVKSVEKESGKKIDQMFA
jgi:hypothetical protein